MPERNEQKGDCPLTLADIERFYRNHSIIEQDKIRQSHNHDFVSIRNTDIHFEDSAKPRIVAEIKDSRDTGISMLMNPNSAMHLTRMGNYGAASLGEFFKEYRDIYNEPKKITVAGVQKTADRAYARKNSIQKSINLLGRCLKSRQFLEDLAHIRQFYFEDATHFHKHYVSDFRGDHSAREALGRIYDRFLTNGHNSYDPEGLVRFLSGPYGFFEDYSGNTISLLVNAALLTYELSMKKNGCIGRTDNEKSKPMLGDTVFGNGDHFDGHNRFLPKTALLWSELDQCISTDKIGDDWRKEIIFGSNDDVVGVNDYHADMILMLALQAERLGINYDSIKDPEFCEKLADCYERWQECVFAGRALSMFDKKDNDKNRIRVYSNLSKEDADFLAGFIKKNDGSHRFNVEQDVAGRLKEYYDIIRKAQDSTRDNIVSVMMSGYSSHRSEGAEYDNPRDKAFEVEYSLKWLEEAKKDEYLKDIVRKISSSRESQFALDDSSIAFHLYKQDDRYEYEGHTKWDSFQGSVGHPI